MKFGLLVTVDNTEELTKAIRLLNKEGMETHTTEIEETPAEELYTPTATELRNILIEVKELKGAETAKEILAAHGGKTLKTLPKEEYAAVYATAKSMLEGVDETEEELEEQEENFFFKTIRDNLDMEEDTELDPELVKIAVQKYAKRNGKAKAVEILKANGLNTVRGLKAADGSILAAIYKTVN